MTFAIARARLDAKLFDSSAFAEDVTIRKPDLSTVGIAAHVKTRIRDEFSDRDQSLKQIEEVEVLIQRSDFASVDGHELQRAAAADPDRVRWFKHGYNIDSHKKTRYRVVFERELIRSCGVSD